MFNPPLTTNSATTQARAAPVGAAPQLSTPAAAANAKITVHAGPNAQSGG